MYASHVCVICMPQPLSWRGCLNHTGQGRLPWLLLLLVMLGTAVIVAAAAAAAARPSGTKLAGGVTLGASTGGGMLYVEPPAAVAGNNELAAARAEALSAEEAVLWELSGRLMGVIDDVSGVSTRKDTLP
jgi:hypothetical protein